jgi:hypothetical protein
MDVSKPIAVAAAALGLALCAVPASATYHEYCFWDGSYSSNSANTKCYQSGDNYLVENYAYLPYVPILPTIYCGANQSGSQYGSVVSGNPDCRHLYGGGALIKAWEYVNIAATTHGVIQW